LTNAILEPEATSVTPNHTTTSASPAPSADNVNNATVDASEIEIDPTTHLPFLKGVNFSDFNISAVLKSRLRLAGFTTPTPVQAKAIPPALLHQDILATASTGTGKTLSFLIPMIEHMDANPVPAVKGKRGPIRALILLPTRELAMQVLEAYGKLVPNAKHDAVLVCGGLSENTQLDQLGRGPRLVVATPGRLEDFLRRRAVNINSVELLVLDEVDRMLDMGFLPAIRRIVGSLPRTRQTMCYSATLDANVREIVRDYVKKGTQLFIEGKIQTRSWDDKEGKKRYSTDIVADRVVFLGGASGEGGGSRRGGGGRSWGEEGAPQSQPSSEPPEPMGGPGPGDDDIPF